MKAMYEWHRRHHSAMKPQDVVKLYFQAYMGCGHLLGEENFVARRIEEEEQALSPTFDEPLLEPLGPSYVRLNLRRAMAEALTPLQIARLMKASQQESSPERSAVVDALSALNDPAITAAAQRLVQEPSWIPSHTQAYHEANMPAYRVISRQCAAALPVLQAVNGMTRKNRLLLCIDGACGSGKSTLSGILGAVLDAAVVPMDDFFLPHPLKTPERLARPGGNADWERLRDEFLTPWLRAGTAVYRPYDCHTDDFGDPLTIPERQFTIIEGSYSLMPDIRKHADLSVFLTIAPEVQQQRILARNGQQMLDMFNTRWIPLEKAYHQAFGLPDADCLVIQSDVQLV